MNHSCIVRLLILLSLGAATSAQVTISGRVWGPIVPGSEELYPYMTVLTYATPAGSDGESIGARTWETHPSGWHTLSGNAGTYTFAVVGPSHFMRPKVITNQFMAHGDKFDRHVVPPVWYAVLKEQSWDNKPAQAYIQTFVAKGPSVTHVGFKLAHDGVDGEGRLAQVLLATVHEVSDADPLEWKQIGPTVPVLDVNAGGVLNIRYAAGWNSGEVPTTPGKTYAIKLSSEKNIGFQGYWHDDVYRDGVCYRVVDGKAQKTDKDFWMYIAGDGDGLVLPFNKRVQHPFYALTKWGPKWSQTYVSKGRGLASVVLYAAVSTEQAIMNLQRVRVRIRRGGPSGPVVGTEKIAVGLNTATAESGNIGVVFAPGEVDLKPGATYAIEFEAFGSHRGFNPWMKQPRDPYEQGNAYFKGSDKKDYDLDMIVVEYEHRAKSDWTLALEDENVLSNSDMQAGRFDPEDQDAGTPAEWEQFKVDPGTTHWYVAEEGHPDNRVAAVAGGSLNGKTVDGGYVQQVSGLKRAETYRLLGKLRSTWPVDEKHQVMIGLDPTGQTEDCEAASIVWTILPRAHGVWEEHVSEPTRPAKDRMSIWLRARTTGVHNQPFIIEFDDIALRQVTTSTPR